MARLSLAITAQAALSAASTLTQFKSATRTANPAWPTKHAFYANHFYTGREAMAINI